MRVFAAAILALVSSLATSTLCHARFKRPQIESVPVERLVKNMEAEVEKDPKNPDLLFGLARIHSMAYAVKSNDVEVQEGKDGPWFGFVPRGIPYQVQQTEDEEALAAAKAHLEKAIDLHKSVVDLNPDHYLARLGLARL